MRSYFKFMHCGLALGVLGGGLLMNQIAEAQTFLWRTNVGAAFLTVDAQTNIYVTTANKVITLNSDGIPQATNTFILGSPLQRDDFGNYYFAGVRSTGGTGNFGTTNAFYLAKYTGAGSLVWSNNFGPIGVIKNIALDDLELDKSGNVYAGYAYNTSPVNLFNRVARIDNTGSVLWDQEMPQAANSSSVGTTYVTVLSPTNGWVLTYIARGAFGTTSDAFLSRFDVNGTATVITNWTPNISQTSPLVRDSAGNFFTHETSLTKRDPSGAIVWQVPFAEHFDVPLGSDPFGGVYTGRGDWAGLTRYDSAGNLTWGPGYTVSVCQSAFSDSWGNRFFSFTDGSIARMAAPSVGVNPQSGEGLTSTGFLFSLKSDPSLISEIQTSSNFTSWDSLGFVTNDASGQSQFLDPGATNSSEKYYRIRPQ